jgi:hypothetical protein
LITDAYEIFASEALFQSRREASSIKSSELASPNGRLLALGSRQPRFVATNHGALRPLSVLLREVATRGLVAAISVKSSSSHRPSAKSSQKHGKAGDPSAFLPAEMIDELAVRFRMDAGGCVLVTFCEARYLGANDA